MISMAKFVELTLKLLEKSGGKVSFSQKCYIRANTCFVYVTSSHKLAVTLQHENITKTVKITHYYYLLTRSFLK